MKKNVFFFNKQLFGMKKHVIRRPVEEYIDVLLSIFGMYAFNIEDRIRLDLKRNQDLPDDRIIYLENDDFRFINFQKSVNSPSDQDMESMINLFRCFVDYVSNADKNVPLSMLTESSDCFPKFELGEEYQAELDDGKYLLFSLGDYPQYYG